MCAHCTSSATTRAAIDRWANAGMPHTSLTVLARPTAETYPNTYVFVFNNAVQVNGVMRDVKVDVHYLGDRITAGAKRLAFGGLWMTGVYGAMKPEQHGGELYNQLNAELPGNAPRLVTGTYGEDVDLPAGLTTELQHHKDKVAQTGTFKQGF